MQGDQPVSWDVYRYGDRLRAYQLAVENLNATYGNEWPCSLALVHPTSERFASTTMEYLEPKRVLAAVGVSVPAPYMACEACRSELHVRRFGVA